ncbi:hypothetical protein G6F55_013832 [Rhizopus delemar]|nr:hypothetical protein G6F55_013832 [Rhizopus delemar]KAG1480828.1 hypothetical protein G6F54_013785 [Rhizopus delemar]KAG1487711.1 hypothetical protein G6F53_013690 [Rhizopus delemar]
MSLFVARIPRDMNNRDLEDAFSKYGKITRFEVKREGFGFVEFDDKRDAEDAMKGIHETVAVNLNSLLNGLKMVERDLLKMNVITVEDQVT